MHKLPPGTTPKGQQKFSHSLQYDHLSRVSTCPVLASGYLPLSNSTARYLYFFVFLQNWAHFGWIWDNNLSKYSPTELKFYPDIAPITIHVHSKRLLKILIFYENRVDPKFGFFVKL